MKLQLSMAAEVDARWRWRVHDQAKPVAEGSATNAANAYASARFAAGAVEAFARIARRRA